MNERTLFYEGSGEDSMSFYIQPSLSREREREQETDRQRQTETYRDRDTYTLKFLIDVISEGRILCFNSMSVGGGGGGGWSGGC